MKVTREFIMDNRTVRGAWTRLQIQALGIVWPPRHGWIEDAIGRELTLDQVHQFVNSTTPLKRKGDPHSPDAHTPRQGFLAIQNPAAATNAELLWNAWRCCWLSWAGVLPASRRRPKQHKFR